MDVNNEGTQNGRDPESGRFLPGNSGFGGRPKGSRNKLGEQFVSDLYAEWQKSGADALKRVAQDDPTAFVRVVANILPREIDATLAVDVDLFAECRDFAAAFRLARSVIGAVETDDVESPLLIEASDE
jgi:hypothetical protein